MKAVVMAGGSGSRLRPLTIERPKPMVPVVNKPILGHILDVLKRHGIHEVIITVQFLANMVQDYFGDGRSLDMDLVYSVEEEPLGTAGSVKNAQYLLDDTFLVISGDALTNFNLSDIIQYHRKQKAKATVTLYRVKNPLEYGVIITNSEGHITKFLEKPSWGQVISDTVNTGIYVLEPEVLDLFEANVPYDFSGDLFPLMLERNDRIVGWVADGYWCDIGNISEYRRALTDLLEGKIQEIDLGHHIGGGIWTGEDVDIAPGARLFGPIYLGNSVKIKSGVVIHGPTVIRDYTVVDDRAQIDRSIIWRNCYIGENVELRGAIILRQCALKSKAVVFEGSVIADGTIIGEGAIIHPNVKIWPGKEVEPGATVKTSIIWGSQGRRVLFGRYGVTGVVNVDLTPEFTAKLGAAFGATLPKGAIVTINRDPHRSPRMLKRAVVSGLPSAGLRVWDLRSQPIPVARYYTAVSEAVGGMHVRVSPFDQRVVDIRFIDSNGLNLSKDAERQVERVFFREDFRRVYLDEIGTIEYAPHVLERYTEDFLKSIDVDAIRAAQFALVVDYASSPVSQVLPNILNELNCEAVALNANVDETKMSVQHQQFEGALNQLKLITKTLGTNLGFRLDAGGEKIYVVDSNGELVSGTVFCAAMAALALRQSPGSTVAIPVNQPQTFEQIARQYDGHILRTKVDAHALMQASRQSGVILAGDGAGNFIFPAFQPSIDGMMALAKLLEFLAVQHTSLSEVVRELPPFHVAQQRVPCPWDTKGKVMRLLNQQYEDYRADTVDGIKIGVDDGRWVLILPDPDQPYFQVVAEAKSQDEANSLAREYALVVEGLRHSEETGDQE
ncbi:MAG: sugar phosphate nucleotidyltransferase [Anaerolineae bacterium]